MTRKFKKILITGITGSGGSYLAEHIIKKNKNIKIFGFYRSKGFYNTLKKYKQIKLEKIDLSNFKKLNKLIKRINPDVIFHMASNANVRESFDKPLNFIKNNNSITANLLESVRVNKLDPVILICSSSEVYGNVEKKLMPIKEDQKISPINPYAGTKAFQDIISQIYYKCFGLKIIITRMFSYTNARRPDLFQTSFARQISLIEKGMLVELKHGNLKSIRTFIDIEDAMEAYWVAATKGKIGQIYNIGGNKVISVENFLKCLISMTKKKIKTKLDTSLLRPKDINIQLVNSSKFFKDTGWKAKIKFNKSVENLLNECRKLY